MSSELKQLVLYTLNREEKNCELEWVAMIYRKYIKTIEKFPATLFDYGVINYNLKPKYFRDLYKMCPDKEWIKEIESGMKKINSPSQHIENKHRGIYFATQVLEKYNVLDFWFIPKDKYHFKEE